LQMVKVRVYGCCIMVRTKSDTITVYLYGRPHLSNTGRAIKLHSYPQSILRKRYVLWVNTVLRAHRVFIYLLIYETTVIC